MSRRKKTARRVWSDKNRVELIPGGHLFFERLQVLLKNARHTIYFQFYIFLDDSTGSAVIRDLREAAARGVKVSVLLDGYASQGISRKAIHHLREAGVELKWFDPLWRSRKFYFGRRLHHKVVVVDGCFGLVGGLNIADRYNDTPEEPAWMDAAIFVEGEACISLEDNCRELWGYRQAPAATSPELVQSIFPDLQNWPPLQVRINRNDWVKRRNEIWVSYLRQFQNAEKEITIMCSYFLPGRIIRKKIIQAIRRGVKIRVVLAGVSDILIAKQAERYLYDWLLRNKVEVYEYQKTILHAKLATADDHWTTVGSFNVNNISTYASLELNVEVEDISFAIATRKYLDTLIREDCHQITLENYKSSTNFLRRFWQRTCYRFINNVLNLFTFYFRQE